MKKNRFADDDPPPLEPHHWPAGVSEIRPQKPEPKKSNGGTTYPPPEATIPIPKGESAFSLTERDLPKPVRLCDPWATEGVNIIAGRPKLGKTTLERQKMAAAATGSEFLDSKFNSPVKCAFLSLEEGELLCRDKFLRAGFNESALTGIQLHFAWERGEVGCDLLDRYLTENGDIRFVVIDSLSRFRSIPDVRTPQFMADYEAINRLHEVSKKHHGVVIDVIHHTKKVKSDDPIDDVSGSYGLTAAADTVMVMRHHADGAQLFVASRLWERDDSQFLLMRGKNQTWTFAGIDMGLTDQQATAFDIIKAEPFGIGGKELGDKLGITQPSAFSLIGHLQEKGVVIKRGGKAYAK